MATSETKIKTDKPGIGRRAGRALVRVTVTLAVASVAVVAVGFGSQKLAQRAEAVPAPDAAPVMPVATRKLELASGYAVTRSFVGQVEAQRTAVASFELNGQLDEILVDEGDVVKAGQPLATLDTSLLEAERTRLTANQSALEAQLRFARQTVERLSKLNDQGFASQAGLDEALARSDELVSRIAEVEAALTGNAIQTEKSKVYASFDGRVTQRMVDGGESVSPGQPLVEILENGAPQLRVGLPLDMAADELDAATLTIAGKPYEVALITLRPDVDPVTRTRTALFEIKAAADVTFGQTARLSLQDRVEDEGLWVPITTLKEGLRAQWTLLVVDAENVVRTVTVHPLHTKGEDVFVQGAFPDGVSLIASGPQRVSVGQKVDPQPAS